MSKFLLNLLLQISKALINSKIQFLIQKSFFLAFGPISPAASRPIRPLSAANPTGPPFSHRPCARTRPIPTCAALAYLPKAVSSSSLRSPAMTLLPDVTAKRAPPISSIFHLAPADPDHAAASPHLSRPPSLYLEMPSQGVNSPTLIPRVNHPRSSMALMP
jgi:hypothetical protein